MAVTTGGFVKTDVLVRKDEGVKGDSTLSLHAFATENYFAGK